MVLLGLKRHLRRTSNIPSDQCQLFYRALLLGKTVEPDLPLENYVVLCGGKGKIAPLPIPEPGVDVPLPLPAPPVLDEDLVIAGPEPAPKKKKAKRATPVEIPLPKAEPAPGMPKAPPPLPPPAPPGPGGGGAGGDGPGGGGAPPPTHGGPCPGGGDAPPIVDVDPDLVVGVGVPPPMPHRDPRGPKEDTDWQAAIGGGEIRYHPYVKVKYPNYKIKCNRNPPCPLATCAKTRGVFAESTAVHGRIEPLAYLHAWRLMHCTDPTKSHGRHDPSQEEVGDFVTNHRAALEELERNLTGGA